MEDDKLVLRWYWRYHSLHVEVEDSVYDAISQQTYMEDEGAGASDTIEVWDANGTYRTVEWDSPEWVEYEENRREIERREAERAKQDPPITHTLEITKEGEKQSGTIGYFYSEADALERVAQLTPLLGNRVRVVKLNMPH